jgi:hypothetical protein
MPPTSNQLKSRVIALGMGWTKVQEARVLDDGTEIEGPYWWDENKRYMGGGSFDPLPKFFESVDACIAACETIYSKDWSKYLDFLAHVYKTDQGVVTGDCRRYMEINAPADKRAEALYLLFL